MLTAASTRKPCKDAKSVHARANVLARLHRDRRGVSAVEFALIAPVMMLMFFGMSELTTAVMVQRRVSHANAAVGDLVAQYGNPNQTNGQPAAGVEPPMEPATMNNVFTAANLIIGPYPTTPLVIRITSLIVDTSGNSRISWSCVPTGQTALAPMTAAAVYTPPSGLISTTAGDSLVVSETQYSYSSPVKYFMKNAVNFNNTFYFKPRASTTGVGFTTLSTPYWSQVYDSKSTAQSVTANSVTCSYQTG